ncbi:uncharacterized protein [Onthophagus taurus]|uniref:uncharacterized protein n=1 Tax=Onthophagus taurus TaxID=166361 RepID=UPI0039BDB5B3
MRELGSRGNVEKDALYQYIIDGIEDESTNKTVLYGAKNNSEFKEKLEIYDKIRKQKQTRTSRPRQHEQKDDETRPREKPKCCYNCVEKGHFAAECKFKEKGLKCFNCKQFGHKANDCSKKSSTLTNVKQPSVKKVATMEEKSEYYKDVNIDGSDVVTMREETAIEMNIQYVPHQIKLRGFGQGMCESVGKRTLLLEIDGVKIEAVVLIVPNEAQQESMIVGQSALDQPGIRVTKENKMLTIENISRIEKTRCQNEYVNINSGIGCDEIQSVRDLVSHFDSVFSTNSCDIGTTDLVTMNIDLTSQDVVRCRPYRLPYAERESVKSMIDDLLKAGIIRESTSEYSSPVILVPKKDGSQRLCVDYRRLNAITRKSHVTMPSIDEQLDMLAGNK